MANHETMQSERRAGARRALEGYRSFCKMHDGLLRLMEDADSRLVGTAVQMGETATSGTAGDAIGCGLAALEAAAERLVRADDGICARLHETLSLVERVNEVDPVAGRVLSMRYLAPAGGEPTLEEIAEELGYGADWVRHLHLAGLDLAAMFMEHDTKKHMDPW